MRAPNCGQARDRSGQRPRVPTAPQACAGIGPAPRIPGAGCWLALRFCAILPSMRLGIRVNPKLHTPLAEQIAEKMRRLVKTSRLCEGETVPSVRALAEEIGVNFATVSRAYKVLQAEGVLKLHRSRRFLVAAPAVGEAERAATLRPAILGLKAQARELRLSDSALLTEIARVLEWNAPLPE